ncbi:MAG: imelysin family protein [Bacteroidia bacterium]|nr:imelysin family protein [Bacteroidia bacterium]
MRRHFPFHTNTFKLLQFGRATLVALLFTLLISSCKDDPTGQTSCLDDYDVTPLLTHYADDIIVPGYQGLLKSCTELQTSLEAFTSNPDEEGLDMLRGKFISSYTAWQSVAMFEFGPAEEVFLRNSLNNFPLNQAQTVAKINNADLDFSSPSEYTKGYPALDYLLFGLDTSSLAIVDSFSQSSKYSNYLAGVVNDMLNRVQTILTDWESYGADFKNRTGSAAGESLSLLVNGLNENYESIKRDKLGVPSGVLSLGFTNPKEVEAYYSGISVALTKEALEASKQVFSGGDGIGMDDVLNHLKTEKDGVPLTELINDQFDLAIESVNKISGALSDAVDNDNATVLEAYKAVAEQVILIKSDMPSVMCIAITYVDNPSDSD